MSDPEKELEKIKQTCDNSTKVEKVITLKFASTINNKKDSCQYRPVKNAGHKERNNRLNAYSISTAMNASELNIPSGATLCGASFGQLDNEELYYDDHIFVLFNNNILTSSYPYHDAEERYIDRNSGDNGLLQNYEKGDFSKLDSGIFSYDIYQFEWNKLQGASQHDRLNDNYPEYCVEGNEECSMPTTQQVGPLKLKLSDGVVQELFLHSKMVNKMDFNIVTTGDNDTKKDCSHSEINLEVKLRYVNP